ncbi:MAG: ATP-binding protein [Salinivirgaceae bacterium]
MSTLNNEVLFLLKEVEIFSAFDDSILMEFVKSMTEVHLKKDDALFKKGDIGNAMYVIIEGSVQIHDNDYIFTTLNNKQFFGEYSLIDSAVRSATVTAIRDSKLLELKQSTFNQVTQQRPELWKNVLVSLIKRLRDYNILEEKLTKRTLEIQRSKFALEEEKENIKTQKKQLEDINATKDKFFTIIAHDLKNPFSTVISISDLLIQKQEKIAPEQAHEYIKQINKYSRGAFNLLENLLQWAKSQTGSLKISFKRANISEIVNEVVELLDVNASQNQINVETSIEKHLHAYIDVDMVKTIFRNLLSNALKFTPKNGLVRIEAKEDGDMLQLKVTDNGKGIEPELLNRLFKIDMKQHLSQEDAPGTGLGLIICKEFVLKNGGEIWAESEVNKETTFYFTLPKAL